mgnify:CR=1 FL=1
MSAVILASVMFLTMVLVYKFGNKSTQGDDEKYGKYQFKRLGLLLLALIAVGVLVWTFIFQRASTKNIPQTSVPSTIKSISPPLSPQPQDYTPFSQISRSSAAKSSKPSSLLSEM